MLIVGPFDPKVYTPLSCTVTSFPVPFWSNLFLADEQVEDLKEETFLGYLVIRAHV